MKSERIYLYEGEKTVYLDTYLCDESEEYSIGKRPAMLVVPGGGYHFCSAREAEPVARAYMNYGFNCFVLRYSCQEEASRFMPKCSKPLVDASLAMKVIRERKDEFNIDENKIAAVGFSAGGHLVASLGTLWNDESIKEFADMPYGINKPNAIILGYPVITFGLSTHGGTKDNLLGKYNNDEKLIEKYSCEKQVSENTAPAFIWHTATDGAVPVVNPLDFAKALAENNVPFELHVYPYGGHGMSIATKEVGTEDPLISRWVSDSVRWVYSIFDK